MNFFCFGLSCLVIFINPHKTSEPEVADNLMLRLREHDLKCIVGLFIYIPVVTLFDGILPVLIIIALQQRSGNLIIKSKNK